MKYLSRAIFLLALIAFTVAPSLLVKAAGGTTVDCTSYTKSYDDCRLSATPPASDPDCSIALAALDACTARADAAAAAAAASAASAPTKTVTNNGGSTITSSGKTPTLINPLGETDPRVLIGRVISALLSIIGSLVLLMFIYGGMLWITSMGEPKKVQKGKDILVWTVAGLGIVAAAYVLTTALINSLTTGSAI